MIKKLLAVCTFLLIFSSFLLPDFIINNVTKAEYVIPKKLCMESSIYCKGIAVAEKYNQIYTDTPVIPSRILCSIGEKVEKGDILAEIDAVRTVNILTAVTPMEKSLNQIQKLISLLPDRKLAYMAGEAYGMNKVQIDKLIDAVTYNKTEKEKCYVPDTITAPADGIITEINLSENVMSSQSVPAIVISSCEDINIVVNVPQKFAGELYCGMEAEIICDDRPVSKGKIKFIYPTADNNYNEPSVKVIVKPEISKNLKSGYNVKVRFYKKDETESLTIPVSAINQDNDNNEYVYVFDKNEVIRKDIETGEENAKFSQVKSGLTGNEMILITESSFDENKKILIQGEKSDENHR